MNFWKWFYKTIPTAESDFIGWHNACFSLRYAIDIKNLPLRSIYHIFNCISDDEIFLMKNKIKILPGNDIQIIVVSTAELNQKTGQLWLQLYL